MKNSTKKKSIHYVDNKKFQEAMVDYFSRVDYAKANDLEEPKIPEYIGECFFKISSKLACNPNFINYSFRDEMISDGYETCVLYIKNYDPKRGNPFAYFTQFAWNAFVLRIKKEKKHSYIKFKSLENAMINNDLSVFQDDDNNNVLTSVQNNDYMNNIISSFEEDVKTRKIKSKKKKDEENA